MLKILFIDRHSDCKVNFSLTYIKIKRELKSEYANIKAAGLRTNLSSSAAFVRYALLHSKVIMN